jgi:hypothetical protein
MIMNYETENERVEGIAMAYFKGKPTVGKHSQNS